MKKEQPPTKKNGEERTRIIEMLKVAKDQFRLQLEGDVREIMADAISLSKKKLDFEEMEILKKAKMKKYADHILCDFDTYTQLVERNKRVIRNNDGGCPNEKR